MPRDRTAETLFRPQGPLSTTPYRAQPRGWDPASPVPALGYRPGPCASPALHILSPWSAKRYDFKNMSNKEICVLS